jgi:hypothetical protein
MTPSFRHSAHSARESRHGDVARQDSAKGRAAAAGSGDFDTIAAMALHDEIIDLLRRDPAFREELRRQLLTEEVLGLPAVVRELVEAQRRTEERLDRLIEQVQRQGEQIERLAGEVRTLVSWQRGEAGRRDGERFEREIVRRAPALFNGGHGGPPDDPWVRQRLAAQLRARLDEGLLPAEEDPFLADLLWWKGDQVAVVEVSIQVNGTEVARAAARAATLARAGAQSLALVVGDQWATLDTARRAESAQVAWKVGDDLSSGFLALRRLRPSAA